MSEDKGGLGGQQMEQRLQGLANKWAKGQVTLKQIVGLSETELYAIAQQGYLMFLQGKLDQARIIFEGLVAIDPKNAYYYRALGAIYWRGKESQKAVKQFTYAIRVSPKEISSYINRAEVYVAQQNFKAAKTDLKQALEKSRPGVDDALHSKARAMMRMI